MKLLNSGNAKTRKGEKLGYITYGIHLAPSDLASGDGIKVNTCPHASAGCRLACLNTAGRGVMSNVQKARIEKTRFWAQDRSGFLSQLEREISAAIKSAKRKGLTPCFRLNLTSDISFHTTGIMEAFSSVQFYDYTKSAARFSAYCNGNLPENYHITFSRSECNDSTIDKFFDIPVSGNVAVVFRNGLPSSWKGRPVIDGDETDLRFLDLPRSIVGLVEKGRAKRDETGFVIETNS